MVQDRVSMEGVVIQRPVSLPIPLVQAQTDVQGRCRAALKLMTFTTEHLAELHVRPLHKLRHSRVPPFTFNLENRDRSSNYSVRTRVLLAETREELTRHQFRYAIYALSYMPVYASDTMHRGHELHDCTKYTKVEHCH